MRQGTPSQRFGQRGLHILHLGGGTTTPLLLHLYGADDQLLASLSEERGECLDPGHVDFFLGPNCRPARYARQLVETLPDGRTAVVPGDPAALSKNPTAWLAFLDAWISRHEPPTPS
ncbi:hypothetical protein NVV93_10900 [Pseudomonas sp. LS44]|uniref:hypothetical protein n=1 Tax=Pseudomonas sp. LS44 TaxID=1357074 RepID=UPI00215AF4AD|nr:hypothetical protein [Pseudomonas sp. LS44]UVE16146.1 hypothetical protein NVV93_10900 [Pseudomonas sp. LS44]